MGELRNLPNRAVFSEANRFRTVRFIACGTLSASFAGVSVLVAMFGDRLHLSIQQLMLGIATFCGASITSAIMATFDGVSLSRLWNCAYAGSEWATPSNEIVTVKFVDSLGITVSVTFEDGSEHTYPFRVLESYFEKDEHPKRAGDSHPSGLISNVERAHYAMLAVTAIAVALTGNPLLLALFFCTCLWHILLRLTSVIGRDSEDLQLFMRMAGTRWLTMDGRHGSVRWAKRKEGAGLHHSDFLTLKLSDGSLETISTEELMPYRLT